MSVVRQSAPHIIKSFVSQAVRVTLLSHYVILRFGSASDRRSLRGQDAAVGT
jgi:hypothetical protein